MELIEFIAQVNVLLLDFLMGLVESLVLRDDALLALEHVVKVLELLDQEYCLIAHHWVNCVQSLNVTVIIRE